MQKSKKKLKASNVKSKCRKAGRPEIAIDWTKVEELLIKGATGPQAAAAVGVHPETMYDRCVKEYGVSFTDYSSEKRSKGDSALHAKQFETAMKGNSTMQIWLGKQRLGQKEPETRTQTVLSIEQLDSIKQLFEQVSSLQEASQSKKDAMIYEHCGS